MQRLQRNLLATACLALAAAAFAPSAQAATNCSGQANGNCGAGPYTFGKRDIFGGGSSLVAPYWRQTLDCYSASGFSAALISNSTNPPNFVDETFFNFTGTPPQTCPLGINTVGATEWYISTGSGTGIKGLYTHDATQYGHVDGGNTQYFPDVLYGLSDAGLGSSDVSVYNSGGTEQGIVFNTPGNQACNTIVSGEYPNPLQCFGPLIQFPFSVDPVAMFYGGSNASEQTSGYPTGIYEKWDDSSGNETYYRLNVQNQRGDGSGGLRLSPTSYCGIWNGQITNWNDTNLTNDNGGVTLEDPSDPSTSWSVTLIPVGRSDSSGTTSIITRHLANVCSTFSYNKYQTGATTLQSAGSSMSTIIGNTWSSGSNYPGVDQAGKITLAKGSSGVASYVAFTASPSGQGLACGDYAGAGGPSGAQDCIQQARVGYVGPDYVLPYVLSTNTNAFGLESATLQNSSGNWEAPSPKTANTAFGSIQPPQSAKNGKYCASCLSWGMRNDPTAWVEGLSPTALLANPSASGAYPLVGTTNVLAYTCYATVNKARRSTLEAALHFVDDNAINYDTGVGILAKAGLSPLPKQWITAIQTTFVSNSDGLGLNIANVGTAGACSVSGIVGG